MGRKVPPTIPLQPHPPLVDNAHKWKQHISERGFPKLWFSGSQGEIKTSWIYPSLAWEEMCALFPFEASL